MNEWERSLQGIAKPNKQLALYDRYGSMAYGVSLQILPQPLQAQKVLVALFASSDLQSYLDGQSSVALAIVRMARTKALTAKAQAGETLMPLVNSSMTAKTNLPDLVFDMSFRQGYSIEAIAEKLQLTKKEVLKAIRDYSVSLRQA